MKKRIAMLMIAAAVTLGTTPVFAAEQKAVWIDAGEATLTDNTLNVQVQTNGEVTDGVLEITYDTSVLSIDESDVLPDDQIDMYSVNVEDGKVKISYLSEEAIEAGELLTLNFTSASGTSQDEARDALSGMTGTNYKKDGEQINQSEVGIIETASGGENPSTPGTGGGSNTNTPSGSTQAPAAGNVTASSDDNNSQQTGTVKTGDETNFMVPAILGCAGVVLCGAAVYAAKMKRKGEQKNEI